MRNLLNDLLTLAYNNILKKKPQKSKLSHEKNSLGSVAQVDKLIDKHLTLQSVSSIFNKEIILATINKSCGGMFFHELNVNLKSLCKDCYNEEILSDNKRVFHTLV
jgi:hypothetical protein